MQQIRSSNPPVVTGIFDPIKSQERHHNNKCGLFAIFCTVFCIRHITDNEKSSCDKAHDHNEISIRMLKIRGSPTCRPFKNYLQILLKISKVSTTVEKS